MVGLTPPRGHVSSNDKSVDPFVIKIMADATTRDQECEKNQKLSKTQQQTTKTDKILSNDFERMERGLDKRVVINVGGMKFETWSGTLERIPGEILCNFAAFTVFTNATEITMILLVFIFALFHH